MRAGNERGVELPGAEGHRVETFERGPDAELGERLVAFWTEAGALDEAAARERVGQVICVAFGPDGEVEGVNSAYEDTAPLIGRKLWLYRRFLRPGVPAAVEAGLLAGAYEELARRHAATGSGPAGLCLLIRDRPVLESDRNAVWEPGFVYAGYTDADEQVRVAYFPGARV